MVESLNHTVDLTIKGTSFVSMTAYGEIMVGDKAFEFYDERNTANYIQIPWENVDAVVVSLVFGGKYIPRFAFKSDKGIMYSFAAKDPKKVLRAIREYIPADRIVRSLSFFQVLGNGLKNIGNKIRGH